jgi:hypothetical protein
MDLLLARVLVVVIVLAALVAFLWVSPWLCLALVLMAVVVLLMARRAPPT